MEWPSAYNTYNKHSEDDLFRFVTTMEKHKKGQENSEERKKFIALLKQSGKRLCLSMTKDFFESEISKKFPETYSLKTKSNTCYKGLQPSATACFDDECVTINCHDFVPYWNDFTNAGVSNFKECEDCHDWGN